MNTHPSLVPLSIPQWNIWYTGLKSGEEAYTYRYIFDITGVLDVPRLENAIRQVISRHAAFRFIIVEKEGIPSQADLPITDREDPFQFKSFTAAATEQLLESGNHDSLKTGYERPYTFLLTKLAANRFILAFAYHHIMFDGSALKRVFTEISTWYNNKTAGIADITGPEEIAIWESGITAAEKEQSRRYWKDYIGNSSFHLALPVIKRPSAVENNPSALHLTLPVELSQRIRDFAKENNTTVFRVLLSLFGTLMYNITGEEDFVISYYADLRPVSLRHAIGHYVGMQPARFIIKETTSFHTLLEQTDLKIQQQRIANILPYILGNSGSEHLPYSNVAFGKTVSGRHFLHLDGLDIHSYRYKNIPQEHELSIMYDDDEECISLYAEFQPLLEAATVASLLHQYQALLHSALHQPGLPVGRHSLLLESDKNNILKNWANATEQEHHEGTVIQWFEKQAMTTPDACALIFKNREMSYGELNEQANKLATHLQKLGAKPNVPIVIFLGQSFERIIAILATAKAGAAYVPLEPNLPEKRLQFILQDTAAPVLITTTAIKTVFNSYDYPGHLLLIDDSEEMAIIATQQSTHISLDQSDNLAYIRYTSGTTGKPKGVMIAHRSLANFTGEYLKLMALTPASRVLQYISISFDISEMEIWCTLCRGARLYLYPDNRVVAGHLYDFIVANNIHCAILPPATLDTLPPPDIAITASLQTILLVGEATPLPVQNRWKDHVRLINAYGPTEATVCVNHFLIDGTYPADTIGQPVSNTTFYVLDKYMQLLPPCITGELYIGGVQVARGYLNQPELTLARFVDDPFASNTQKARDYGRLYKTGDLARYLPDGYVEYLGRNDLQVKIRGYRIELEEIEHALRSLENIKQAIAKVWTDSEGKKIAAYLVHTREKPEGPAANADIAKISRSLKEILPTYMVPTAFLWIDKIPITDNGKTDRNALPMPPAESSASLPNVEPIGNEFESVLANTWREALHHSNFSVRDNFFDVGGHSLLLTQIYTRLPETYKRRFSLTDMFRYPNIKSLVEHLKTH